MKQTKTTKNQPDKQKPTNNNKKNCTVHTGLAQFLFPELKLAVFQAGKSRLQQTSAEIATSASIVHQGGRHPICDKTTLEKDFMWKLSRPEVLP